MTTAPPVPYFGGKQRIAGKIVAQFPAHEHYVEPFAGSLSVLLAKPLSLMETVNDLDGELMAFWRVLRDRPTDLERVCTLTPHARAEFESADTAAAVDELELARRVWVRLVQGRGGTLRSLRSTGWRYHVDSAGSATGIPAYLKGYAARIAPAAERLMRVSLECRPAAEVIEVYGRHPGVLLYLDPPYLVETRSDPKNRYRHEMKHPSDHADLLAAVRGVAASVVISGYRSELYDELLGDWFSTDIPAATGQGSVWSERVETLWSNRPLRAGAPGLFEVTR